MKYDANQIAKKYRPMKSERKPAQENARRRMHTWCYCVTASVGCGDQGAEQVPGDVYKPSHLKKRYVSDTFPLDVSHELFLFFMFVYLIMYSYICSFINLSIYFSTASLFQVGFLFCFYLLF